MAIDSRTKLYPDLAEPITVTAGNGAWILGDAVEIVPVNAIGYNFHIRHIHVIDMSANDEYQIVLYANGEQIASEFCSRTDGIHNKASVEITTDTIPANSKIEAKIATSGSGLTPTLRLRISYC